MARLRLKVIKADIIEKDFSRINLANQIYIGSKTIDDQIKEVERMFEFEEDKTQMHEIIKQIKNKTK